MELPGVARQSVALFERRTLPSRTYPTRRACLIVVVKMPMRDYFTGKFIIQARQIISEQTQAEANI